MKHIPDLRESFDPPPEIIEAGLNGELILFVGAGVSRLLALPSWKELAAQVLEELRQARFINYSELEQLRTLTPKIQMSIADLLAHDNQYALDITKYLKDRNISGTIYESINNIGCSCVTTNYDELIAPRSIEPVDDSTTSVDIRRISDRNDIYANLLNEPGTVIHLHGSISKPETMVVTTKEYLELYDHKNIQEFLGEMFEKMTILFLGYGLEETEILEHILRRGSAKANCERKRFVLQGYYLSQVPLYYQLYRYYEHSFGVHLLGYVKDYENHKCLEKIIKSWVEKIQIRRQPLVKDIDFMIEVLGDD